MQSPHRLRMSGRMLSRRREPPGSDVTGCRSSSPRNSRLSFLDPQIQFRVPRLPASGNNDPMRVPSGRGRLKGVMRRNIGGYRLFLERQLNHRRTRATALQRAAGRSVLAAKIAYPDAAPESRRESGACDLADIFAIGSELSSALRNCVSRKFEADAYSIHVPARANAFHNFLAGVAALRKADVRCLEPSFMRDHVLVEIVAEPRNLRFEPQSVQRVVADWPAADRANAIKQRIPQRFNTRAFNDALESRHATRRASDNARGNSRNDRVAKLQ